jgi:hypothetical protein
VLFRSISAQSHLQMRHHSRADKGVLGLRAKLSLTPWSMPLRVAAMRDGVPLCRQRLAGRSLAEGSAIRKRNDRMSSELLQRNQVIESARLAADCNRQGGHRGAYSTSRSSYRRAAPTAIARRSLNLAGVQLEVELVRLLSQSDSLSLLTS